MSSHSMQSSLRNKRRRAMSEINVVPYIDVMLVLLVIFMTTAAFVPTGVVKVPSAGKSDVNPSAYIEIAIQGKNKLSLRSVNLPEKIDQPVNQAQIAEIVQRLRSNAKKPDIPVVIAGDGSIKYEEVMAMIKTLRDQGIDKVSLLVKR